MPKLIACLNSVTWILKQQRFHQHTSSSVVSTPSIFPDVWWCTVQQTENRSAQVTCNIEQGVSRTENCAMVSMQWTPKRHHCAMAFPPSECHCSRQERGGDSAACASPSAPESLTRGHENTTSQVRVSGTERDTSSHGLLHLPTWQLPLDFVFYQNGYSKIMHVLEQERFNVLPSSLSQLRTRSVWASLPAALDPTHTRKVYA